MVLVFDRSTLVVSLELDTDVDEDENDKSCEVKSSVVDVSSYDMVVSLDDVGDVKDDESTVDNISMLDGSFVESVTVENNEDVL